MLAFAFVFHFLFVGSFSAIFPVHFEFMFNLNGMFHVQRLQQWYEIILDEIATMAHDNSVSVVM